MGTSRAVDQVESDRGGDEQDNLIETNGRLVANAAASGKSAFTIPRIDMRILEVKIIGTAPYMQRKFSEKAQQEIRTKHESGQGGTRKKKDARDFDAECQAATHVSTDGWCGIPAAAFRCALVDVCRTVGIPMTNAKMSAWVIADGYDVTEGTPLVRIHGTYERKDMPVRIQKTVTITSRPVWREWWCLLRIEYDFGMLSTTDVVNLVERAGRAVGVGEGRPFSKSSCGLGYGTFMIEREES